MNHWKSGIQELYHEIFFQAKLSKMQKYIPELERKHFEEDCASGVRAMVSSSGDIIQDFLFETNELNTQLHVRNAPSPAATASFAIAEEIYDKAKMELPGFPCGK